MNANVVAEYVVGDILGHARQKREVKPRLKLGEEFFSGPAFLEKEIFHACALAAFAQALLLAEDLNHGANHGDGLAWQDEGVETDCQVGVGGESAPHTQRVTDLAVVLHGGEADVVDLGVAAPGGAAGDGDFELAGQVEEFRISVE